MTASLRLITTDDLERVMYWRMLPDITRYMYTDPVLTLDSQREWFARVDHSERDIVWIIELADGTPVGVLSLSDIDHVNSRCVWAYYIAEEAGQGKGLAKPLECSIADFVLETLGLQKLWCEVFATNDRVVALHERFGSKVEGTLREHIRKGDDVFDVVRMGLLRDDWFALRPSLKYTPIPIEIPFNKIKGPKT